MSRPFRNYCLSLVERLGFKTLNNLYNEMTTHEIFEWMAYDMLQNPETRDKLKLSVDLDNQKSYTADQEASAIRKLFAEMGF